MAAVGGRFFSAVKEAPKEAAFEAFRAEFTRNGLVNLFGAFCAKNTFSCTEFCDLFQLQ